MSLERFVGWALVAGAWTSGLNVVLNAIVGDWGEVVASGAVFAPTWMALEYRSQLLELRRSLRAGGWRPR